MGELETISNSDWRKLTPEQRQAVRDWAERVMGSVCKEADAFEQEHPDMRLICALTPLPIIRANHPELEPPATPKESGNP